MKKVVSTVLAMTMVLSMAVSGSAATVKSSKKTSSTSTKTTSSTKKSSSEKSSSTKKTKSYDFCTTQLKGNKLASSMHSTILSGLKANKNKITVNIKGYSEQDVYNAFGASVQMIIDQHPEIFWLDTFQNIVIFQAEHHSNQKRNHQDEQHREKDDRFYQIRTGKEHPRHHRKRHRVPCKP